MRATFMGIETARRALQAQQRSMDVTAHNIANANAPGYSRQRAVQQATIPYPHITYPPVSIAGQVGSGVQVTAIQRVRDAFIEAQLRNEIQLLGEWRTREEVLAQLELILLEPSDVGLGRDMDAFWEALQDLHMNPEDDAARAVVRQRALALTETFQHVYRQIEELRQELDVSVAVRVEQVNTRLAELGSLNQQIRSASNAGYSANDLLDRRDQLLRELSEFTNLSAFENLDGTVRVAISGMTVVDEWGTVSPLEVVRANPGAMATVRVQGTSVDVKFRGGELAGLIAMRDQRIPELLAALDELALGLIQEFNAVHRQGFDANLQQGGDFFVGNGAKDITLHPDILDPVDGLTRIAAGYDPTFDPTLNPPNVAVGNGQNALRLAQLRTKLIFPRGSTNPTMTLGGMWSSIVSGLGVDSLKAKDAVRSVEVVVGHLENQRESISGVSLDEEMADMIRFQHAYNAAARLMTTLDEMLSTIINSMGLVGR